MKMLPLKTNGSTDKGETWHEDRINATGPADNLFGETAVRFNTVYMLLYAVFRLLFCCLDCSYAVSCCLGLFLC